MNLYMSRQKCFPAYNKRIDFVHIMRNQGIITHFLKGRVVGYGNLEHLKNEGVDILSMIRVDEEQNEGQSFSSESLIIQEQQEQVAFKPNLKRHSSHSPVTSRRKKYTSSSHGSSDVHDPLIHHNLDDSGRTQSAHDLQSSSFSSDVLHNGRVRATSSVYDLEYFEREEILSQVSGAVSVRLTFYPGGVLIEVENGLASLFSRL